MDDLAQILLIAIPAACFLAWFCLLPVFVKAVKAKNRRSPQGGMVGALDEVFHPAAHEAGQAWEAETELPAPAPTPGDKPFDHGRITITVPRER